MQFWDNYSSILPKHTVKKVTEIKSNKLGYSSNTFKTRDTLRIWFRTVTLRIWFRTVTFADVLFLCGSLVLKLILHLIIFLNCDMFTPERKLAHTFCYNIMKPILHHFPKKVMHWRQFENDFFWCCSSKNVLLILQQ